MTLEEIQTYKLAMDLGERVWVIVVNTAKLGFLAALIMSFWKNLPSYLEESRALGRSLQDDTA